MGNEMGRICCCRRKEIDLNDNEDSARHPSRLTSHIFSLSPSLVIFLSLVLSCRFNWAERLEGLWTLSPCICSCISSSSSSSSLLSPSPSPLLPLPSLLIVMALLLSYHVLFHFSSKRDSKTRTWNAGSLSLLLLLLVFFLLSSLGMSHWSIRCRQQRDRQQENKQNTRQANTGLTGGKEAWGEDGGKERKECCKKNKMRQQQQNNTRVTTWILW